jgi:hypothetical protein
MTNPSVIYFFIHMKNSRWWGSSVNDALYEVLIPYLAGDITTQRLQEIENGCAEKIDDDDWLIAFECREAQAEWEALEILFRL